MRYPHDGTDPPASTRASGRRAVRRNASRTMSAFTPSCAAGSTCCQSHPPHPRARAGHGGVVRTGEGSSTSTTSARAKSRFAVTNRATTSSPGSTPGTNTTRPLASRASPSPPATSDSMRRRAVCSGTEATSAA